MKESVHSRKKATIMRILVVTLILFGSFVERAVAQVTYPVDLKKYPAAAIPMANIALFTKVPEVWFDNFKIELVK